MYGYENSNTGSNRQFGLNQNATLTKFQHSFNAGKDGAPLEALQIEFNVGGQTMYYSQFPVTQAYGHKKTGDAGVTYEEGDTSEKAQLAFKKAFQEFNKKVGHVVGAFVSQEEIKEALSSGVSSFEDFCNKLAALLPENFDTIPLDIFLQYQWNIKGDNDRTFLQIPNKTSYGTFLVPHVSGNFQERRIPNPSDKQAGALRYVELNDEGQEVKEHPFRRNGWFMNSKFANQQTDASQDANNAIQGENKSQGVL